jgi:hypothetical protein
VFNEEFLLFWEKLTLSSLTNKPHERQEKHTFGQELVIHHFAKKIVPVCSQGVMFKPIEERLAITLPAI